MPRIPLPGGLGLPDINVDLPDIDLPDISDIDLPSFPGLPNLPNPGDVEGLFWELVDMIDQLIVKYRLQSPKIRPILDQFSLIDSARFKEAARTWGLNLNELGIPAAVGKGVADKVDAACDAVNDRWQGTAATNFNTWMTGLSDVVDKYGAPAHQVGNVLDDIAEEFKLNWLEIIGLVGGMAGLIVGLAFAPATGGGSALVGSIIGVVLGAVLLVVSVLASIFTRLGPVKDGIKELADEVNKKIPRAPDAAVPLPKRNEWTPKTTDPNS